jgi:hypothetical protein
MADQATRGDVQPAQPDLPRWLRWFIDNAPAFLVPSLTPEPKPSDRQYVRSFMVMRIGSGLLAFALPLLLVGIGYWLDGDPWFRGSLSEYYYSGAREVFVGLLSATAVFLFSYKVIEVSLENLLSISAAAFVLMVVLFPTGRPLDDIDLTPLQDALGESLVETVHFIAAAAFISLLAVISFFFGVREARRTQSGRLSPKVWRRFHWGCAIVIVAAIVWILATLPGGWGPSQSILIGEWVAVYAFAASWLTKGFEYHYLFRGGPAAH